MRYLFGYSVKQLAAACVFSGLIAAGVSAQTIPSTVDNAPTVSVYINRATKSDRLFPAPKTQRALDNSGAAGAARSPKPIPVGCEPPFSPIAAPAHADIVKRCLA
jgi:hypothetical protein